MRLKLGGQWVRITRKPLPDAWGYCVLNPDREPEILIHDRMSERQELEILIHEAAHLADWQLSENQVDRVAKTAAELLYKTGWRKHDRRKSGSKVETTGPHMG